MQMRWLIFYAFAACFSLQTTAANSRVPSQVYVAITGVAGDPDQYRVLESFLNTYLSGELGNSTLAPAVHVDDWKAEDALKIVPPIYDHYVVAHFEPIADGGCKSQELTSVSFEVGRFIVSGGRRELDLPISSKKPLIYIGYPLCDQKGHEKGYPSIVELLNGSWQPRESSTYAGGVASWAALVLPEFEKYDTYNHLLFDVSCLDRSGKPWMVSDILASNAPPDDLSAQFESILLQRLVKRLIPPWEFAKRDVKINSAAAIKALCSSSDGMPVANDAHLHFTLIPSLLDSLDHNHALLQMELTDWALKRSLIQTSANLPFKTATLQAEYAERINNEADAITVVIAKYCTNDLTSISSDRTAIGKLADDIRKLADDGGLNTGLQAECEANVH